MPKQMNRDDGFCFWRDGFFKQSRVDGVVFGMDVHKLNGSAHSGDRFGGRNKSERGGDDLISGTNSERPERQDEGVRSIRKCGAGPPTAIVGKFSGKILHY